jgi:hypothetical protein
MPDNERRDPPHGAKLGAPQPRPAAPAPAARPNPAAPAAAPARPAPATLEELAARVRAHAASMPPHSPARLRSRFVVRPLPKAEAK